VIDSGSGIDPEDLAKIFQPFFSAKKGKGIGLGLSISERIIKNHGGTIAVESMPGKGTTFRIHLPLEQKLTEGVNVNNGQDPTEESEDIDKMMKLFGAKA
jgi:two-component system NtrC family sensor kinase